VAGELAGEAQVAAGGDEARSKELLPEPVDRDAGGERVVRLEQPLRQSEAARGPLTRHGREERGRARLDRVLTTVVLPAVQHVGHGRPVGLGEDVGGRAARLERAALALQTAGGSVVALPLLVDGAQPPRAEGGPRPGIEVVESTGHGVNQQRLEGEGRDLAGVEHPGVDAQVRHRGA